MTASLALLMPSPQLLTLTATGPHWSQLFDPVPTVARHAAGRPGCGEGDGATIVMVVAGCCLVLMNMPPYTLQVALLWQGRRRHMPSPLLTQSD